MINFRFIVGSTKNILITLAIIFIAFITFFAIAIQQLLINQNYILPIIWFCIVPILFIVMKKLSIIFYIRRAEKIINDIEKNK